MSAPAATTDRMALWDSVRTPDPQHTKNFSRSGGFKGTATNPTYLIRCATELWGPIGGTWRLVKIGERYEQGAPILGTKPVVGTAPCFGKDGTFLGMESKVIGNEDIVVGHEIIHVFDGLLEYPGGAVEAVGQTTFVGTNKYGSFTDEEAPKKSRTDAMTKALSLLGFAADIHMGMWEDSKYVNEVRATKAAERKRVSAKDKDDLPEDDEGGDAGREPTRDADAGGLPWYAEALKTLTETDDPKTASATWDKAKATCRKKGDPEAYAILADAAGKASARIAGNKTTSTTKP